MSKLDQLVESYLNPKNIRVLNRDIINMSKTLHQTIRSPHLTEKVSELMQKSNQYAFKVDINSTKREIKKAVESYFSVEVKEVTVLKVKGKNIGAAEFNEENFNIAKKRIEGTINIGMIESLGAFFTAPILEDFQKKC